eukprot:Gb_38410 [translate_table: standard]
MVSSSVAGGKFAIVAVACCIWLVIFASCKEISEFSINERQKGGDIYPYGRHMLENGLGKTPPMGWNSWRHFKCNVTEKIVRETADAIVARGLHKLGYVYINIDNCWAKKKRDQEGKLVARYSRFPSGMKAVSDYVHSKGLKFGIYSDAGKYTCHKAQPGSLGHEEVDAYTFASWEVDYLKYAYCYNQDIKPELRYSVMRDALLKTGRPIFFSLCEWGKDHPALWANKVGNSWRTTRDMKARWHSITTRADLNNIWAKYAGPGGWNDPDILDVGNVNLTPAEARSHFSLWALMKAPLLIGCDVRNMDNETFEILSNRNLIAINQDKLGIQGRKVSRKGHLEVWASPLAYERIAVVMWNRGKVGANITTMWEDIGLESNRVVQVRDIWKYEELSPSYVGSLTAEVGPHDCKAYILLKESSND